MPVITNKALALEIAEKLNELRSVSCSRCAAKSGEPCVFIHYTPRLGQPMNVVHNARTQRYILSQVTKQ